MFVYLEEGIRVAGNLRMIFGELCREEVWEDVFTFYRCGWR